MSLAYYLVLFPIPPKIFSIKIPGFPEISRKFATAVRTQLRILRQRNQRFQLLWSKPFEFFHDVCIIIQLQEPRVELHLLGKRKSINVAVSDIAVYRVTHTLGVLFFHPLNMIFVLLATSLLVIDDRELVQFVTEVSV